MQEKLKVGDKVLCKKTIYSYTAHKYYYISLVDAISVYISNEMSDTGVWFYFDNETNRRRGIVNIFEDYFFTDKELRKLKLEILYLRENK